MSDGNNDWNDVLGRLLRETEATREEAELPSITSGLFGLFTYAFSLFVNSPLAFFAQGFLTMYLWNWFLPSLGLAPIGLALALGINLLIAYVRVDYVAGYRVMNETLDATDEEKKKAASNGILKIWLSMGVRWLVIASFGGTGYVLSYFL